MKCPITGGNVAIFCISVSYSNLPQIMHTNVSAMCLIWLPTIYGEARRAEVLNNVVKRDSAWCLVVCCSTLKDCNYQEVRAVEHTVEKTLTKWVLPKLFEASIS